MQVLINLVRPAYATGLLLARRVLQKLGLDDKYAGNDNVDGTKYTVEPLDDGPRPFTAFLDVGLRRTTTGSRVFGALKGAADGGLNVPHGEGRFPGYDSSSKSLDAEVLRNYIFGIHVSEYMEYLQEEDEEAYKRQFASYLEDEIEPDQLEEIYTEAHAKIRENPAAEKKSRELTQEEKNKLKKYQTGRLNLKQRNDRVRQKKEAFHRKLAAGADEQ